MKTSKNLRTVKPTEAKLEAVKTTKKRERKSTKLIKTTKKIGKARVTPSNKRNLSCKSCISCKRLRSNSKGIYKMDRSGRRMDAKRKDSLQKFKNCLNTFIISTFNALIPSCISYVT